MLRLLSILRALVVAFAACAMDSDGSRIQDAIQLNIDRWLS